MKANVPGEIAKGLLLTTCEERVLDHVLRGETNREIAERLGCSVKNIEYHVSNILRKAGQPSRTKLLAAVRVA
ncbi:MAG TPA: LuxR C-terminal-related transcriptional regulator [Burkholderiales bacterium]|jgi:DNA-binding NarL/FixJ family response regulator|nr:LuxR C-terminal-related transcriptional regulator [Burkholderiales bacterium]